MTARHVKYRLGLDMGTNSIGWAAVELDADGESHGIVDMGVRIFPDGRDAQTKTSNAVDRRIARGQRRRRDRYLDRRDKLMTALVEFGLMPEDEVTRKKLGGLDPYEIRARALDEPLGPFDLGRALFHLNQRRGFKSNRKAGGDDEDEAEKTRAEINELRGQIRDSGARTLGEYLWWRHMRVESVRARPGESLYPDRAMYESEFDAIRDAQEPYQGLSAEQWEQLHEIIFFQRPLKPVDPGSCRFEDEEKRAARALPVSQEFRILQEVNNLRVLIATQPERHLSVIERERALNRLRSGKDITLAKGKNNAPAAPTRDLGLPSGTVFNLAAGGRKVIKGDETTARLKKEEMFGKAWLDLPLEERNEIVRFLLDTEDPDVIRKRAIDQWGLGNTQAEAVANVSLVAGYGNLSEKAIGKMLPHMEDGLRYDQAAQAAGYHHSDFRSSEALDKLPYYGKVLERDAVGADPTKDPDIDGEPARYGRISNPTVHIGLNQLRRVVNRLIEVYGKPEEIVVELARDLKMNRVEKQNYLRRQREGADSNRRFEDMLASAEEEVTSSVLRKLRLWEEQGPPHARLCPYTGRQISFEMAVSSQTQVDHILPFSETLDNSMSNMVLCMIDANQFKGNRSPYDAFGHSPEGYDYDQILIRAAQLPSNKRWRFQPDAMERFEGERDFLDRQLNETRYLSRTARTYLAHLYDERTEHRVHVRAIPGRMTALLRYSWGLNGILREHDDSETPRKRRDDHRHHAVDAFVVANTTQRMLQRFAQAAGSYHGDVVERLASRGPLPWEGFHRSHLKPHLDNIVVSYKPDHGVLGVRGKTTGQLHQETAYGLIKLASDGPSKVVVRRKLADFKKRSDLNSIRDSAMRDALQCLWDEVGGNAAEFADRAEREGVNLNGRRQPVRRIRTVDRQTVIPIEDRAGKPYKGYLSGGNEFADVWRMRDGRWKIVVVPTFHANQPDFNIEDFRPTTSRGKHKGKPDPAAKRLMRLQIDDMGALGEGSERRIVRVRKVSGSRVWIDDHNEANVDARVRKKEIENTSYSASRLRDLGFRKVIVDEIGRVFDPGQVSP